MRGHERQHQRRAWDVERREIIGRAADAGRQRGMALSEIAEVTETSLRSLQRARSESRTTATSPIRYRGRPPTRSPVEARNALLEDLRRSGLHVPVDVYQNAHPDLARREVIDIMQRARVVAQQRGFVEETLTWMRPGTVWSVDHTSVKTMLGKGILFVVRDPALRHTWDAPIVATKGMREAARCIDVLIRRLGTAPLVLKADNAFDARPIRRLCRKHGIQLLLSPPYYPRFNASAERGIGVLKEQLYPLLAATDDGLTPQIVAEALTRANRHSDVSTGRADLRHAVTARERVAFNRRRTELEVAIARQLRDDGQTSIIQASVTRDALSKALLEWGLLTIRRRRIHLLVSSRKGAKITCG